MKRGRRPISVVTGAASGIGRAIALHLGRLSDAVVIADIDAENGADTARRITATGGNARSLQVDVASESDVQSLFRTVERDYGRLDVLVNDAGIAPGPNFPHAEPTHWQRTIDVNLRGVMLCIHYALQTMRHGDGGSIVNISSMAAVGFRSYIAPEYSASKAAIMRLTASLGGLSDEFNVRVNCICPGWVETDAVQQDLATMTEEEKGRQPFPSPKTLIQPEEVAEQVWWFVTRKDLSGRVLVWPDGESARLVDIGSQY